MRATTLHLKNKFVCFRLVPMLFRMNLNNYLWAKVDRPIDSKRILIDVKRIFVKVRMTLEDVREIIYQNDYRLNSTIEEGIRENVLGGNYRFGNASMHEILFDGVYITFGDVHLKEQTVLRIEADAPFVEMHFTFTGHSKSHFEDQQQTFAFNANQHNIMYAPYFRGSFEVSHHVGLKMFEVGLSLSLFHRLANHDNAVLDKLLKHIQEQRSGMLGKHNLPITPQMSFTIQEIMRCNRSGYFKRLFLEAKVIELFMLQVEQFEEHNCKTFCTLKKKDTEKIYEARAIIEKKVNEPCSLLELSHQVGLNDFKLKKGFKEIFGTTVFGYLNDLKMDRAKELLLSQDIPVGEIARITGFKNQTHFTVAFKKKFGILPKSLRV